MQNHRACYCAVIMHARIELLHSPFPVLPRKLLKCSSPVTGRPFLFPCKIPLTLFSVHACLPYFVSVCYLLICFRFACVVPLFSPLFHRPLIDPLTVKLPRRLRPKCACRSTQSSLRKLSSLRRLRSPLRPSGRRANDTAGVLQ
jgi:hypothetical protein